MTIDKEDQLDGLKQVGGIVARTLEAMRAAAEHGVTTAELDAIGAACLEREGARSPPPPPPGHLRLPRRCLHQHLPGHRTWHSEQAGPHARPAHQRRRFRRKERYFADTGASFVLQGHDRRLEALCRDGKRALWTGIRQVKTGGALNAPGVAIEEFARKHRYTLVRNLASHGVGGALHEEPGEIPTWKDLSDRRRIHDGLVFTLEPFLSMGAEWAVDSKDGWTLFADKRNAPTVQYEHTLVATKNGPVITTLAA